MMGEITHWELKYTLTSITLCMFKVAKAQVTVVQPNRMLSQATFRNITWYLQIDDINFFIGCKINFTVSIENVTWRNI